MSVTQYNNPFNIRPGQNYAGEVGVYTGKDGSEYVMFDSMELGLRAGLVDLRSKIRQKDGDLLEMIKKFAPEQDQNDPQSYFNFVSNELGKDKVTEEDLPSLAKAFIKFENTPNIANRYLNQFDELYPNVKAMSDIDMPKETTLDEAKQLAGVSSGVPLPQERPPEPVVQDAMPELITTPSGSPASSQSDMAELITEPSGPKKTLDIDPIIDDNIIDSPDKPVASLTDQPLDLLTERQRVADDIDGQIDIDLGMLETRLPKDTRPKVVDNYIASQMLTESVKNAPMDQQINPDAYKAANARANIDQLVKQDPFSKYKAPVINFESKYPTDPSFDIIQGELMQMQNRDVGDVYSREDLYPDEYYWFTTDSKQIWSAAWRQYNPLESASRAMTDVMFGPESDKNYDVAQDKRIPPGSLYRFIDSSSYEETTIMLERFKSDMEDMAVIANSDSTLPIVVSSVVSPSSLAPFTRLKFLNGANGTQRFLKGGAYGMAIVAPEEFLMAEQLYTRDASHAALVFAASGIISGSLNAALGKTTKPPSSNFGNSQRRLTYRDPDLLDMRRDGFDIDGDPVFRPVGAGVTDEAFQSNMWRAMEQDALKETGVGLERLGWNPTIRLFKSESPSARGVVSGLVDVGGLQQKKVDLGIAMDQSVETTFRTTYFSRLRDAIESSDRQYLEYRKIISADGDIKRQFQLTGVRFSDIGKVIKGTSNQSHGLVHFRNRVGMAMRRGDVDKMNDEMTPFVNKASKEYRKLFNFIKDEAQSVRLFERELQGLIKSARQENNVRLVAHLEEQLRVLREQGVTVNTAASYLPRVPRIDKIMDNQVKFRSIVEKWSMETLGMNSNQAKKFALSVMDSYTINKPFFDLDDIAGFEDMVKSAGGLKSRVFNIPDELIEEFLESDVEALARHHTKTMGIDIELARKYGDIDMRNVIDAVKADYKKLMDESGVQEKPVKFDSKLSNIDSFEKHFKTGESSSVTMFRGSGGNSQVKFEKNVFGDGIYLARTNKTAKLFGQNVEEVSVNLKNPIVFKSDIDLEKYYKKIADSKDYNNLIKTKNDLFNAVDNLTKAIANKEPLAKIQKLSDDIFLGDNSLVALEANARRKMMEAVSDYSRREGYDSAVFSFRQQNFSQLTKGDLTPSKMLKELNATRKNNKGLERMALSLSHDQIVLFTKIEDYKAPIIEKGKSVKDLQRQMENDIRDIKGLRDRLRGTYGASKDPHAVSSRFYRAMKSFNVIVGMGGAMVSSVPDIARIVMVEGIDNFYRKGMVNLFKSNQSVFKKMTKKELKKAGVAVDAELGLRAAAMSDIGDMMGSRFTWERGLSQTAAVTFFMNGLNFWNYGLKNMSGTITMLHMTENIMKPWSRLSGDIKEKFLKNGIDEQSHMRMQALIKRHGERVDGEWLPNTDLWQDATMRLMFRNALNQNVDRIIITPGAADRALWTSTDWGSFLTQFKGYGQGAMMRMTTAGLQESNGAFWQGAFLIVGLGAAVNEIKRLQYGIDKEETYREKLINAIDRSGIGGWFTDVNNSLEKLTDYRAGIRPFIGGTNAFDVNPTGVASQVAGPGVGNILTASSIFGDIITGSADQGTLNSLRYITPGTTLPYLDPIYDGVFGQ